LAEGFIIRTRYQHAGRGHGGNRWESGRGENLLFSVYLKPDFIPPDLAFHLSRITSLSLHEILDNQCDGVQIKWPNDMLVGERKIAGILIENMIIHQTVSHSIIGIGINVNQTKFDPYIPVATSLQIEKGCHIDMHGLLSAFRSSLEKWYQTLLSGNAARVIEAYRQKLYRLGVPAEYRSAAGRFTGTIRDVKPSGELVIESGEGNILTFGFKEVAYLGFRPPDRS
jgi:BirA family biotin operon repressor/biotin-[acetyl-CoA-carboxylase] ligase